jgi:hypothetical protein
VNVNRFIRLRRDNLLRASAHPERPLEVEKRENNSIRQIRLPNQTRGLFILDTSDEGDVTHHRAAVRWDKKKEFGQKIPDLEGCWGGEEPANGKNYFQISDCISSHH